MHKNTSGLLSVFWDITQQKQSEEKLSHQHNVLEAIFSSLPDAIILTDTTQHIVMANHAAEKMFGYTNTELVGLPLQS